MKELTEHAKLLYLTREHRKENPKYWYPAIRQWYMMKRKYPRYCTEVICLRRIRSYQRRKRISRYYSK